jgi:hypothetical protein
MGRLTCSSDCPTAGYPGWNKRLGRTDLHDVAPVRHLLHTRPIGHRLLLKLRGLELSAATVQSTILVHVHVV